MGYVIKTGGTPGGATAANQVTEINTLNAILVTLQDNNGDSVFKDPSDISVFKDLNDDTSVFKDITTDKSVYVTTVGANPGKSILAAQCQNAIAAPCLVQTFTAGSFAGTAALLQTYLNTNDVVIVNISFSQGLGTHDILLVCNVL
jgi:hypothetical protein